jgi:hypothetical protein
VLLLATLQQTRAASQDRQQVIVQQRGSDLHIRLDLDGQIGKAETKYAQWNQYYQSIKDTPAASDKVAHAVEKLNLARVKLEKVSWTKRQSMNG